MARARSMGVGPYVVALVFFGLSFVIALILAILFYTRIEAAEASAKKAGEELNAIASATERQTAKLELSEQATEDAEPMTVVGQLLSQNRTLKQIIVGNAEANMNNDIRSQMTQLSVSEGNLLRFIKVLQENRAEDQKEIERKEAAYVQANESRERAEREKTELVEAHDQTIAGLKGQLSQVRAGMAKFQQQLGDQGGRFEEKMRSMRSDEKQNAVEHESVVAQKNQIIDRQDKRIKELQEQLNQRGLAGDIDPSLLPDGRVASILGDKKLVYIDRGRADHIIRGLTFEVYDAAVGIVRNQFDEFRGKATIEVVSVEDRSSKCRIVRRLPSQEILEGDVIGNVVYDPSMILKFFVYGEFDIDSIGQATQSDRRRIELMVQQWGAQLVSSQVPGGDPAEINYDVDFLVLGKQPALPEEPGEDVVDPLVLKQYERSKTMYENYHSLVAEGQALSIPILNQNRFLTMAGYYRR